VERNPFFPQNYRRKKEQKSLNLGFWLFLWEKSPYFSKSGEREKIALRNSNNRSF